MRKKGQRVVYSEDFKREKIAQIESGKLRVCELVRLYGVHKSTVYLWKEKYGSLPKGEKLVIEKDSEYLKNIELRKEVKSLQNLIGRQQMMLDYYNQVIKQANISFETDIEKKFGSK